jgi:hypothetical protein
MQQQPTGQNEETISTAPDTTVSGKEEDMYAQLDKIGLVLAYSRSSAIYARQNAGIEEEWLEDEEYYEGIDDSNRNESTAWRGKPLGQALPLGDEDKDHHGSTIFLNITRSYVDATAARLDDMLSAPGEKTFKIKPTPRAELLSLSEGKITPKISAIVTAGATTDEQRASQTKSAIEQATELIKQANEAAAKVERQIWDWHVETQFAAQNRRVIEDAAKVGTGILKGPIPTKSTKMIFKNGKIEMVDEIKPASIRVSYRNFYPDGACGENIHNGNFTWERDDITRTALHRLIDTPGYINPQIEKIILEGPRAATKDFSYEEDNPGLKISNDSRKTLFEIWYYYGSMKKTDLLKIDAFSNGAVINSMEGFEQNENEYVHVQITMANNHVIRATLSHLQTGDFPYDVMVWQRRMGMPWGIGVARQIRPAQRIIVGAMRHMMDNAGIAGGPMLYIDTNLIQAAEGPNEVRPWKIFIAADDAEPGQTNVRSALVPIIIPMLQEELQKIIELGLKMAEDITGLPLIMQGQTSQRTPNTLGGMQLQNNNASTVLRRVIRLYDDNVTEPHIRRYYDHILQYSEDDELKGEFNVHALGSQAMIERDMASQMLINMTDQVMNPVFGIDPKKWFAELLKANKFDPVTLEYEDEKWQEIVEGLAEQQSDPKVEIAQMQIQHEKELEQFKTESKARMLEAEKTIEAQNNERDRELELMKAQMGNEQKEQDRLQEDKDRQVKIGIAQMEMELETFLAEMKEKGLNAREFDKIKQKITDTTMKLQTQVSLSGTEAVKPAVEPKGRAKDGKSFTQ